MPGERPAATRTFTPPASLPRRRVRPVQFNGADSTPNRVLSQSFSTTPGTTYILRCDVGTYPSQNNSPQTLRITVTGNGAVFTGMTSCPGIGTGTAAFSSEQFTFVANSSSSTLTFTAVSNSTTDIDLLLDNVSVTPQTGP